MSIRARLTLWYALALAGGVALFAAATWLLMWHSLSADLNVSLDRQAASVERFLNAELREPGVQITEEIGEYAEALPSGTSIQIVDDHTRVVCASRPRPARAHRSITRPILIGGKRWSVSVSAALDPLDKVLSRLRWLLITLVPVIVVVGSLGGLWLSRRALKPVDEITLAARSIGIGNLSERLRVPRTGDELERLAQTWNSMLARLEDAVKRLSRFAADASHELRTPLAVIRTTAEIAGRRSRPEAQYREALQQIASESERMTRLVEDLLLLARCDSEGVEMPTAALPFNSVIEDVCSQLKPLADARNIQLACRVPESEVTVSGNAPAIRRLVLVLLDNAIKYSNPGGAVDVQLRENGNQVHLEIQDAGPGIAEAELPRIFERFYRAPEARQVAESGSGLGLSLATGIAKQHHARIEVESVPGKGSLFRVLFEPAIPA